LNLRNLWTRIAGIVGVLTPFVTFAVILTAISHSPWFSWRRNALSDLGVSSGVAALFNLGLILGGILTLLFASGVYLAMKRTSTRIGAAILILAALSLILIGVFPENIGEPHLYASVSFFILLPLSQIAIGMSMMKAENDRFVGMFSVIAGVATAFVWSLPSEGAAIPEALSSALASLWSIVFGLKLYKQEL